MSDTPKSDDVTLSRNRREILRRAAHDPTVCWGPGHVTPTREEVIALLDATDLGLREKARAHLERVEAELAQARAELERIKGGTCSRCLESGEPLTHYLECNLCGGELS